MPANESLVPVAAFDLDGTITRSDTYVPFLAGLLARRPLRVLRALHLPAAAAFHLAGLRDNAWLKSVFLGAVLGGLSRGEIAPLVETFVASTVARDLRPGAREEIMRCRQAGHHLVLASASLDIYVEHLAAALGFDTVICTRAALDAAGRISGALDGGNCYGDEKQRRLAAWLADDPRRRIVAAYSDHHTDLPMLALAERAVAVNPTPRLRQQAAASRIAVVDWG